MCDIWKGNKNSRQLSPEDVSAVLLSLRKLGTKRIVLSGGEALLNKNFFILCDLIKAENIKITLLSTGLTIGHHAEKLVNAVDDIIVSLDGDEETHDRIRNIKGSFNELKSGVQKIKALRPGFPLAGRSVIHSLNFRIWDRIILSAKTIGLDSISFLPADVTSQAFNRTELWEQERQDSVLIAAEDLPELDTKLKDIFTQFKNEFNAKYIIESPEKLQKIHQYYAAHHSKGEFPFKKCNAPWVSTVIEADGSVRPCFFHDVIGSIKDTDLDSVLNDPGAVSYRQNLDVQENPTCQKCVCYLNLQPRNKYY